MNPLVGNSHQGASLSHCRLSEAPFWLLLPTTQRRFIMPLSAEMYVFFDKVAKKNFSLACDVYYALTNGQEITPSVRAKVQEALRLSH
jgi:hypothetical protein